MKQYEIVIMVPTQQFVDCIDIEQARHRAKSICGGYTSVGSTLTGNNLISPCVLGVKEVEEDGTTRPTKISKPKPPYSFVSEVPLNGDDGPAAA